MEGKPVAKQLRQVHVLVPHGVANDLKKMERVTASVLGRLGCGGCHSGYDIRWIQELGYTVNPQSLEVNEVAGHLG